MRKLHRELRREFPQAEIGHLHSGHYRIVLPNGANVFTSATLSCPYFLAQREARCAPAIKGREEGAAVKSNRSLRIFRTVIKKPASPKGCRSNRRSAS
jgi:hypothetical protein